MVGAGFLADGAVFASDGLFRRAENPVPLGSSGLDYPDIGESN
jgi:hypothetical protein